MAGVRFQELELTYGCHEACQVRFPADGRPAVIAGCNGSGKSSLLEGLVRVLFGFSLRQSKDRQWLESRCPWGGATPRGRLVLCNGSERWIIERDFRENSVTLHKPDGVEWTGDGNPGASNQEALFYRERVREIFGLCELDDYQITGCIGQGALVDTPLDEQLLQVAAGGHAVLEEARKSIEEAHRDLTRGAINDSSRAATKLRRYDELCERVRDLRSRLAEATQAHERRAPLLQQQQELNREQSRLEQELDRLETALRPLSEWQTVEVERRELQRALAALRRTCKRVQEARQEHMAAQSACERCMTRPPYPEDFPERLAALQQLWKREEALDRTPALRPAAPSSDRRLMAAAIGGLGVAVIAIAVAVNVTAWAWLIVAAGAASAVIAALLTLRSRQGREDDRAESAAVAAERAEIAELIRQRLEGLPNGETLSPATAAERRHIYEQQRTAAERVADRDRHLREAVMLAAEEHELALEMQKIDVNVAAVACIGALERAESAIGLDVAQKRLRLEQMQASALDLPDGVEANLEDVQRALREKRIRRGEIGGKLSEIDEALQQIATDHPPPAAIQDDLHVAQQQMEELGEQVEALRQAHRLLEDAYERFRQEDQSRLVERVSRHIEALTNGAVSSVRADNALTDAMLQMNGRLVALRCPPLSYGQHQAALLGVRLGATEFLSRSSIVVPLVVDEPFAHLDRDHARVVWDLLSRLSCERQVIVASLDDDLLEHLEIQPMLRLT